MALYYKTGILARHMFTDNNIAWDSDIEVCTNEQRDSIAQKVYDKVQKDEEMESISSTD